MAAEQTEPPFAERHWRTKYGAVPLVSAAALRAAAERSPEGCDRWLTDLGDVDPDDVRGAALLLLDNPWRQPDRPKITPDNALPLYRRAVGLTNLREAMCIRRMLHKDEVLDPEAVTAFGRRLSSADPRPVTPGRVADEMNEVIAALRSSSPRTFTRTHFVMNSLREVSLADLAISLRVSLFDVLMLAQELNLEPSLRKRTDALEFCTTYLRATGIRIGIRAAQVAAGVAELAERGTPTTTPLREKDERYLAEVLLKERRLGWQSVKLWGLLAACNEPTAAEVFMETFETRAQRAQNDRAINAAAQICRACRVRPQCAEQGIVTRKDARDRSGVIGQLGPKEQGHARTWADQASLWASGLELDDIYKTYVSQFKPAERANPGQGESQDES